MMKLRKSLVLMVLLITSILLVACNNTAYENSDNIIEADALKLLYKSEGVVVIDARGQEAYDEGHIVGAVCLPPSELVVDKPVSNLVAPKAKVERKLGEVGIANDTEVYIYDDNGGVNASRIWWTMKLYGHDKVKVVNGGFNAILKAQFDGTKKATNPVAVDYVAKDADSSMMVDFETMMAISQDAASMVKIVDVRSIAEFEKGNIPGSILYPHTNNLYKDGTFMSGRDTFLFYNDKGFEKDDALILYCKSSFRATQALLVLEEAGFENVKIYDGAWLEWEANGGTSGTPATSAPVTQQDGS